MKNTTLNTKKARPLKPLKPKMAAIRAIIRAIIPINKKILI